MSKITTSAGVILSFGFVLVNALPAYGFPNEEDAVIEGNIYSQTLITDQSVIDIHNEVVTAEAEQEIIVMPSVVPFAVSSSDTPSQVAAAPVSFSGGGLLSAARAQIGVPQDCTAMVENALRMIGITVGDLAPMDFAAYGVRVDPSQAQPGDIMMRGGHVSIYAGNNVAVHGGFNGSTVETSVDANPYNYAIIVRV